jgi:hypothetical protein
MTIAVHIALTDPQNGIQSNFNYNCFVILAAKFPSHHFIFIFDKPFSPSLITEKNITPVLAGPPIRNRLLQHYFYNFKIPRLLNKYNVDLFVSAGVCSLRTNVSQYLLIDDLSFLKKKNLFSKAEAGYLKRYTGFFVRKAAMVGVMNASLKKTLQKTFLKDEDHVHILKAGIDPLFRPCTYETAEKTKNDFTDGKDYFLFFATAAAITNVITVLKAFSIFKKWQKSGMQLVILYPAAFKKTAIPELSSYKYRSDIKALTAASKEFAASIIAAAYTTIHLPATDASEMEGLMSIHCAVPLITVDNDFCKSIYHDNALYSITDEKEVSEKLMLLYKDEHSRNRLINGAKTIAVEHNWQNAASLLWQTIQPYSAATPTFAKK